jgi:hypothetical protein
MLRPQRVRATGGVAHAAENLRVRGASSATGSKGIRCPPSRRTLRARCCGSSTYRPRRGIHRARRAGCRAAGAELVAGRAGWPKPQGRGRRQDPGIMKVIRPPVRRSPGARSRAEAEAARPNAGARGYGADWRKLRAAQPHTPCVDCGAPWRHGHHLDHVVARGRQGGTDEPSNMAWRCASCHSRKNAIQDGRWAPGPQGRGGSVLLGVSTNDPLWVKFSRARN